MSLKFSLLLTPLGNLPLYFSSLLLGTMTTSFWHRGTLPETLVFSGFKTVKVNYRIPIKQN